MSKVIPKKPAPQGTAVQRWDAELAALAAGAAKAEENTGGGDFISLKGGILSFNKATVPGNKMNVIILDHVLENQHYADDYDPDAFSAPICFAFGRNEDEMEPHEKSSAKQHSSCEGCPKNEWGSAEKGRGKACKNVRRLVMITEGDAEDVDTIGDAKAAYLKVPVMSVKAWSGYVNQLNDTLKLPPLGVVTEMSVVPDAKSQFRVVFKYVDKVAPDLIGALLEKRKSVQTPLVAPYTQPEQEDRPAPKVNQKLKGRR